mmetsp:Transcript_29917/g.75299  ORF Transcript_29917/g.75299 Transcript_29917/m.75299 type:complete len:347 (-) Transcript_29917:344-1384(-)
MVWPGFEDRYSGEKRREKWESIKVDEHFCKLKPDPILLGERSKWEKDVVLESGLFQREGGKGGIFWNTIRPANVKKIKRVVVYFHGYGDNTCWMPQNNGLSLAKLTDTAVILFDQPGHGRSDGLFLYIPDWFEFVDASYEFCHKFAVQKRDEWNPKLKMFAMGESMGGGVMTTFCLKHPDFFAGCIMLAPMIAVADHMHPPWAVSQVLKHIVAPLFGTFPITPTKDMIEHCFSDPAMVEVAKTNPFGPVGLPRLATAKSMAFQCSEYLAAEMSNFNTPLIIFHGSADLVTEPVLSKRLYDQAMVSDKTYELVEGATHSEMFHGGPTCKEMVQDCFDKLKKWLEKRT